MQTIKFTSSIDVTHSGWAELVNLINLNCEKERRQNTPLPKTNTGVR